MKDFKVYQTSGMLNFLVSEASDVRKKEQTLSGDIVSFNADAQTPTKIVVDIDSTGWTGCEVWNDPKYGGLIDWNQLRKDSIPTTTNDGITVSYSNNKFSIENVSRTSNYSSGSTREIIANHPTYAGHKYAVIAKSQKNITGVCIVFQTDISRTIDVNTVFDGVNASDLRLRIQWSYDFETVHPVGDVTEFTLNIFDLTQMFGSGNEPSTIDEFKALFPQDYYAYNEGTETTVSAVNGDPYQQISVTFPDEVGTITDGTLTINYDGSVTLKTGGQTYTLTSVSPIETYVGDNNIWADAGPVSVTYPI